MEKLFSRKLGVTLATILSVSFQGNDALHAAISAAVGIAYVVAQAFVDRGAVDRVSSAVEEGLANAAAVSGPTNPTRR